MQNFAKTFVKRAAGPVTAAAVGATCAQARVTPTAVPNVRPFPVKAVDEDWVMAHVNGSQVLFSPFTETEIDEGVEEIGALIRPLFGNSVVINEVSPDGSDITDGCAADGVIEASDGRRSVGMHRGSAQELQLSRLLHISQKMLRRPGLQREVVACMLDDPDVRDLMLTQCDDLDAYLLAAGIPSPASGLLMPGDGEGDGSLDSAGGFAAGADGPDLVGIVVNAVSNLLQRTGGALEFLGHWLRDRFAFLNPPPQPAAPQEGEQPQETTGPRPGQGADRVMGSVMVLAMAVVCMLIVRRPLRLRYA